MSNDIERVQRIVDNLIIVNKNPAGRKALTNLFKGVGCEIGVERGKFSVSIMETADKLFAVDLWKNYEGYREHVTDSEYSEILEDAKKRLKGKNVEFLQMDSCLAAHSIPNNSLDFIFIDGNHSYDFCYRDLTCWYDKVKPSGIVSGHDFFDRGERFGVKSAVLDFCKANGINEITEWCGDKTHSFSFLRP